MHDKLEPLALSKREHFAALILAGMCANMDMPYDAPFEDRALVAISQADALIQMLKGSVEVIEPEEQMLNAIRAEFYGDEILLGGIDYD